MEDKQAEIIYRKVYDKRQKKFGIKVTGRKEWYVEPQFDALGFVELSSSIDGEVWFKENGRYGWYSIPEKTVLIPAKYGYPFNFNRYGFAITWKDYKAGVINRVGEEAIPFKYDEITCRWGYVETPDEEQTPTKEDGIFNKHSSRGRDVFKGYVCTTYGCEDDIFDAYCQPSKLDKWELQYKRLFCTPSGKNESRMTLEDLENRIQNGYLELKACRYDTDRGWGMSDKDRKRMRDQFETVQSLVWDRRELMNKSWRHTPENAKRIERTNNLLMRAVSKGIRLAKKTARSLEWMEKVQHTERYKVQLFISPYWQDSKSDYRYTPKYASREEEQDRLDEDNAGAKTHIWNIIAQLGKKRDPYGNASCFNLSCESYREACWDERRLVGDDDYSWDEMLRYPAYQDVYFTIPFNNLCCSLFDYSFEDLCNMNDFRIRVNVTLETREQDKK